MAQRDVVSGYQGLEVRAWDRRGDLAAQRDGRDAVAFAMKHERRCFHLRRQRAHIQAGTGAHDVGGPRSVATAALLLVDAVAHFG